MKKLVLDTINTYYDDIKVLHDCSLEIIQGENLGIVGLNGAGKTTLMNTIIGLAPSYTGNITWNGKRLENLNVQKRVKLGIGIVTDSKNIFFSLTVKENLKIATQDWKWVINTFTCLKDKLNQLAGTLSGGEQQQLALAMALVKRPQLLLVDELSSGLAPKIVSEIYQQLMEHSKNGLTMLIVEHKKKYLDKYINKIITINNGRLD